MKANNEYIAYSYLEYLYLLYKYKINKNSIPYFPNFVFDRNSIY